MPSEHPTEDIKALRELKQTAARVMKRTTPVEVTDPQNYPGMRHIVVPPIPAESLMHVKGEIVEVDQAQLPAPESVVASLAKAGLEQTPPKNPKDAPKHSKDAPKRSKE